MTRLPLEGIRVIDLTAVWAGPYCTRLLADNGAEVIKIEALRRTDARGWIVPPPPGTGIYPDGLGMYPRRDPGKKPYNRHSGNHEQNRNKLGLTLDLTEPQGVEIFKELVRVSDIVAENYTPRVMRQFGLDYPVLAAINPRIILISLSGYGATGAYKDFAAYGTNIEPMAGHSTIMGYAGGPPFKSGEAVGDPNGGINGLDAVLMALWQRRRTGKGQHVDLSQWESATSLIGEVILDQTFNQRSWPRRGNRHASQAPHGVYRCKGEDNWVAISIRDDAEWQRFGEALGSPAWTRDARFSEQSARYQHHDEIDRYISDWASQKEHREAMHLLQAAGVPAGAVFSCQDVMEDPHLQDRDFWVQWTLPEETEPSIFPGFPWKLAKTPPKIQRGGPSVGEHNDFVLREILGLPEDTIAELLALQIIGTDPGSLLYG